MGGGIGRHFKRLKLFCYHRRGKKTADSGGSLGATVWGRLIEGEENHGVRGGNRRGAKREIAISSGDEA